MVQDLIYNQIIYRLLTDEILFEIYASQDIIRYFENLFMLDISGHLANGVMIEPILEQINFYFFNYRPFSEYTDACFYVIEKKFASQGIDYVGIDKYYVHKIKTGNDYGMLDEMIKQFENIIQLRVLQSNVTIVNRNTHREKMITPYASIGEIWNEISKISNSPLLDDDISYTKDKLLIEI